MAVAMTPLPAPDLLLPGADCLLCIAAAVATNSTLNAYAKTLPRDDVATFKDDIAAALRTWGAEVSVIKEDLLLANLKPSSGGTPNLATLDFTALRAQYKVDRLLVVEVAALGMIRPYASYIPTGAPKALIRGRAYLVNLTNNAYEWFKPFEVQKASDGEWSEPPKFPGLTNAYFQVIELSKDELVTTLTKK